MKIVHVEPTLVETPEALVEAPEPEPAPVETPAQAEERQAADNAALSGTKALLVELQSRLATVTAQANEHRRAADAGFDGSPPELPGWLAGIEQHRADAARLATEAEALQRQAHVAEQLLAKLEAEQAALESARIQAAGRKLLTAALERYAQAATEFGDAVLSVGACAILANQSTSFIAATRNLLIPDLLALNYSMPALVGFQKQRGGQIVNQSDPEFQRRANLLRNAS